MPCAIPPGFVAAQEFREKFGLLLTRAGVLEAGEGVAVTRRGSPLEIRHRFRHF